MGDEQREQSEPPKEPPHVQQFKRFKPGEQASARKASGWLMSRVWKAVRTRRARWVVGGLLLMGFWALVADDYINNLGWPGFHDNKLWDWLQLLFVPVALQTATIWMTWEQRHRRWIVAVGIVIFVGFGVSLVGGYMRSWDWTGFPTYTVPPPDMSVHPYHTLWDWLTVLVLPASIAVAGAQFHAHRKAHRNTRDTTGEAPVSPYHWRLMPGAAWPRHTFATGPGRRAPTK